MSIKDKINEIIKFIFNKSMENVATLIPLPFIFNNQYYAIGFLGAGALIYILLPKDDNFLKYKADFLLGEYSDEEVIMPGLTYVLVSDLIQLRRSRSNDNNIEIITFKRNSEFKLDTSNNDWKATAESGFRALRRSKRIVDNETLVRVASAKIEPEINPNTLVLSVEKAHYFDQARSNLILDFEVDDDRSLRKQLKDTYNNKLPDLSDKRLANTLGVAILIWYPQDDNKNIWVPYLVKRVKNVAVFPSGIHCSASGAVKWPNKEDISLSDVTKHMLFEVKEELGIDEDALEDIYPVAFCREMTRGGKPQLFFCARTHKSRTDLSKLRRHARRVAEKLNLLPEIERNNWINSGDFVMDQERLQSNITLEGVTLECAAAVHFGLLYLKDLEENKEVNTNHSTHANQI